jgi:hypothetical protein
VLKVVELWRDVALGLVEKNGRDLVGDNVNCFRYRIRHKHRRVKVI